MAIDNLQTKIRKTKNPTVVNLGLAASDLPPHLLTEQTDPAAAYGEFCRELMKGLKGTVCAVRFSFSAFALLGMEGISQLQRCLRSAASLGLYTLLDAPEILSAEAAQWTAQALMGEASAFACHGVIVPCYLGSDSIRPFLPLCVEQKKELFVQVRSANKSASELQDLRTGTRLVHSVAADYGNRFGEDTAAKFGYACIGFLASAGAGESLRALREKYPNRFLIADGYDLPGGNGKNAALAFDKLGHGALVCAGKSITCAWKQAQSDGTDYVEQALAAAERMRKNLGRYVTIL